VDYAVQNGCMSTAGHSFCHNDLRVITELVNLNIRMWLKKGTNKSKFRECLSTFGPEFSLFRLSPCDLKFKTRQTSEKGFSGNKIMQADTPHGP